MIAKAQKTHKVFRVGQPLQHYFVLSFFTYDPIKVFEVSNAARSKAAKTQTSETSKHAIVLPLPRELREDLQVAYGSESVGPAGYSVLTASGSNIGQAVGGVVSGRASQIKTQIIQNLAGVVGLPGVASAKSNLLLNPFYVQILQGVPVRSHRFSWTLVPENAQESLRIREIIQALRTSTLPPFQKQGEVNNLTYPDFCKIRLTPNVYRFPKPMFVSAVQVNYAADNYPAFYQDGTAVGYEIAVTLTETTALTREDYELVDNRLDQPV